MPVVNSNDLRVGRRSSPPFPQGTEFATVNFRVSYDQNDIDCGLPLLIQAFLYERDNRRDSFNVVPGGGIIQNPNGNRDDFVGTIGARVLPPPNLGRTFDNIVFDNSWDFGNQERGNEEYYAVISVTPTLPRGCTTAIGYTNEVVIDVG